MKKTLTSNELSAFCSQIAMILKSGISLSEGLDIMYNDINDSEGRAILKLLRDEVEMGATLHIALDKAGNFPDYLVNMVEIGEASGRLDNVMESLTQYYEREEAISRTIRNAVSYPMVMIAMMLVVITILVVRVMPVFNEVYQGLGAQMTGFSLAVMNLGQALARHSLLVVGVVAILVVLFIAFRRKIISWIKGSIFRNLYAKIASGKFASAMSIMLASGLDTDKSLEMVHKLVDTPSIQEKIAQCQRKIAEGENFADALVQVEMFSGVYARMVSVAFKTGQVDTVMEKLAARYEEETNTRLNNMISIIEPTLVAILSVIVGAVLLSVMLPLMGIMAAIG